MPTNTTHYTLIISDLHLNKFDAQLTATFKQFINSLNPKQVDHLYILGDLFNLWIGDNCQDEFSNAIKNIISQAAIKIPISIMPGNRDFLLGEKFAADCHATLLHDPIIVDLYGKQSWLTHGDKLCIEDIAHQKAHNFLQNKATKKIFLHLPCWIRKLLAWTTHLLTRLHPRIPAKKMDDMVRKASHDVAKNNPITQIIHGHIHRKQLEEFNVAERKIRRICNGAWHNNDIAIIRYNPNHSVEFIQSLMEEKNVQ